MLYTLHREQTVMGNPELIWDFFASPHNLNTITPENLNFKILGQVAPRMYEGQMIEYRVSVLPGVWTRWVTEITHVREGRYFVDEQRLGPYRLWHHEHHYSPVAGGLHMVDHITYDPGWGPLGGLAHTVWIKGQLKQIFDYRHEKIRQLFPGSP